MNYISSKSLFWDGWGQFVFIWMILGGFEHVLADWGGGGVVMGDCENTVGDWGWLRLIGGDC